MRQAVAIPLRSLRASDQPRPTIPKLIDQLADSLREVGLIQPITVRRAVVVNGIAEDGYQIIAGHHRVAAARALGWSEIEAFVTEGEGGHLAAELVEIDENLCRAELSPAQRASAIKRRKQIWEALNPAQDTGGTTCSSSLSDGRKSGPQHKAGFAAETAERTGQSKQDINRQIKRAAAIPEIDRAVGTSLDKGTELDALAQMPKEMQRAVIDKAAAGEKVSAREILTLSGVTPQKQPKGREELVADFARAIQTGLSELAHSLGFPGLEALVDAVADELPVAEEGDADLLAEALEQVSLVMSLREKVAS